MRFLSVVLVLACASACSPHVNTGPPGPGPNMDAFFVADPPAIRCDSFGNQSQGPEPGGTKDCPDDKNREGCPCPTLGERQPCWPGLRANRGLGQCTDGVTECKLYGEVSQGWGPCEGYVLPDPGATTGPESCSCFSHGTWAIATTDFCSNGMIASSTMSGACPQNGNNLGTWSADTLQVDCTGHFRLCMTLKGGRWDAPKLTDCIIHQSCVEGDYQQANQVQTFPPLAGWFEDSAATAACVADYTTAGAYAELSVDGITLTCDHPSYVFLRFGYCPPKCSDPMSTDPACQACGGGTSGQF